MEPHEKYPSMKRAIVLGCRDIGLGVIRALAAKDISVMAIPDGIYDFAHFSRFSATKTKKISPDEEGAKLLDLLCNLDKDWDKALLLPTNDISAIFISRNRTILASRFIPAVQEWDTISRIINKGLLYQEAQQAGVPLPRVFSPDSVESLMQEKDELTYPCILKPHETHRFFPVFQKKSLVVRNPRELIEKFTLVRNNNLSVMVSEIIPGTDDHLYNYLSYIDCNGLVLAEVSMQKMRQHPPGFGMARVSRTVPMNQEIKRLALKLLKRFSYRGFSSVEFKFDERDNTFKLMEINVRSELQERLFLAAGINFPYITYLDLVEGTKRVLENYQTGVYWIDLIRDLHAFIKWRKRENWTYSDYLTPYLRRKVFCTPFFDDPVPFAAKILILIRQKLEANLGLNRS